MASDAALKSTMAKKQFDMRNNFTPPPNSSEQMSMLMGQTAVVDEQTARTLGPFDALTINFVLFHIMK